MRPTPCLMLAAAVIVLVAGCGHVISGSLTGGEPFDFGCPCCEAETADQAGKVRVVTLGSGGVYIHWGHDAILIGPSFSNPGLLRAEFGLLKFDATQIKKVQGLIDVRAIFAGHSHYDHIGDIPEVVKTYDVPVHVNESGRKMLAAYPDIKTCSLEADKPVPVTSSITVTPVVSDHAPQVCRWRWLPFCTYAEGEVPTEWTRPWTKHFLRRMKGGQTFAFVIELRDETGVRYRIYYNDASASWPLGRPSSDGTFDLAILCMAQWNWVKDYPTRLLMELHPRYVLVSHFDNFFRKDEKGFVPNLSNASAEKFLTILNDHVSGSGGPTNCVCGVKTARWTMPVPGSSLLFDPGKK